MAPSDPANSKISFLLNGEPVTVLNPSPEESLLSYIRNSARLKGTKALCQQGGCGACTVLLSVPEPTVLDRTTHGKCANSGVEGAPRGSEGVRHVAVNSCLRPLCSVDGLAVTTVEGVGSVKRGLHPVQQSIHDKNGSQCGFCTPGFVMSMYSQLKHKGAMSPADVETVADGNICRCTGYRPILDAFQSLSCGDCKSASNSNCGPEIEDLCVSSGRCVKASVARGKKPAEGAAESASKGADVAVSVHVADSLSGVTWRTVSSLEELFSALSEGGKSTRLVCGNTGTGVYPPPLSSLLVDISRVPELRTMKVTKSGITIGAAVTISEFMEILEKQGTEAGNYPPLLTHLHRVANHQVRNSGSVVGNLMLTRQHPDFCSDVATLLVGCGASVAVAVLDQSQDSAATVVKVDLLSFLRREAAPATVNSDESAVVLSVHVPALTKSTQKFFSYKVAQRAVNSHAFVNAAFVFDADPETGSLRTPPVLVFGGLHPLPSRATQTEAFLAGKSALDADVIQQALATLSAELAPEPSSRKASYRAMLGRSFLYKGLLSTVPSEKLPADLKTAVTPFVRPISTGEVSFDDGDPSEYPVSRPIPKLSEAIQTTGEAQYLDDIDHVGELHAVHVRSTVANAAIAEIDASDALALPGVVEFVSAKSVKEEGYSNRVTEGEELLAEERVVYHGQPVGIILAESAALASKAASLVKVSYRDIQPPILSLEDALAHHSFFPDRTRELKTGSFQDASSAADVVVTGRSSVAHQYHFTTETQRSVTIPGEDGCLTVYSSTQNPSQTQAVVSQGTGVAMHKVKVVVKRVGGGYGSKLNRSCPVALASAICARISGRPVRLVLDLTTNMQMVGGRSPYRYDYSVAVKKDGRILGIQMRILNNHGAHIDFEYPEMFAFLLSVDNVYSVKTWDVEITVAKTNLPACTWVRAPGNVESLFAMETMIEHVAASLGLPPEVVRERNLYKQGDITAFGDKLDYCNAQMVIDTLKASSGFEARVAEVERWNRESRWVKRGIALVPVKYCLPWSPSSFISLINIYPDASVSVAHAGVEMGQGLNVKVAQVSSYALGQLTSDGCPLEMVSVKETTSDVANNTSETGGSVGSELTCASSKGACDILVERLRPLSRRMRMSNRGVLPTWQELIGQAVADEVDLQARYRFHPAQRDQGPSQYVSFGAGVSEVQVDLLTGEFHILRSDLLLDCGKSLNPAMDIGQMQGAFVMGLGYLLTEEYEYEKESGKLITDSTWEYKPPSYADIPIDFRAALLQNSGNPYGFLRSKASGEPPLAMACSAVCAIRHALVAAKKEMANQSSSLDVNKHDKDTKNAQDSFWVSLPAPATVERVCLTAGVPEALLRM